MKAVRSTCIICGVDFTTGVDEEKKKKIPSLLIELWRVFCKQLNISNSSDYDDILNYFRHVCEMPFCDGACRNDLARVFILHNKTQNDSEKLQLERLTAKILNTIIKSTNLEQNESHNNNNNNNNVSSSSKVSFHAVIYNQEIVQRIKTMRQRIVRGFCPKVIIKDIKEKNLEKIHNNSIIAQQNVQDEIDGAQNEFKTSQNIRKDSTELVETKSPPAPAPPEPSTKVKKCVFCNTKFSSREELNDHVRNKTCFRTLEPDSNNLRRGMLCRKQGNDSFIFQDTWLMKFIDTPSSTILWTDPDALFRCETCSELVIGRGEMAKHIKHTHAIDLVEVDTKHKCRECGKYCESWHSLQNHDRVHQPIPLNHLRCDIENCLYYFDTVVSFMNHGRAVHKLRDPTLLLPPPKPKGPPEQENPKSEQEKQTPKQQERKEKQSKPGTCDKNKIHRRPNPIELNLHIDLDFDMEKEIESGNFIRIKPASEILESPPLSPSHITFEAVLETPVQSNNDNNNNDGVKIKVGDETNSDSPSFSSFWAKNSQLIKLNARSQSHHSTPTNNNINNNKNNNNANRREQKRRKDFQEKLSLLKSLIPSIQKNERTSKQSVVSSAKTFIEYLNKVSKDHEKMLTRIKNRNEALKKTLDKLQNPPVTRIF